nr:immunoglobulin heavy chain junction region [Macaca mulatta]MOX64881.1 immunoglobulin heavy chain junction region [Macaca mulatta]MOX67330.1 immunoglobulin heavy chain junction region [Macaca mulatta]
CARRPWDSDAFDFW